MDEKMYYVMRKINVLDSRTRNCAHWAEQVNKALKRDRKGISMAKFGMACCCISIMAMERRIRSLETKIKQIEEEKQE